MTQEIIAGVCVCNVQSTFANVHTMLHERMNSRKMFVGI